MKDLSEMNVGETVARLPESARVFEAYGIDFCCTGQISIKEACLARGLNSADVLHAIELAIAATDSDVVDWQNMRTRDLIDHIIHHHHAYLKVELPRIQALMEHLIERQDHQNDILGPLFVTFRRLKEGLTARLLQQETVLFPALQESPHPTVVPLAHHEAVRSPLHRMMENYDSIAKTLSELRRLTSNHTPPANASPGCRELYRALKELELDLHLHFHLENNILFSRALYSSSSSARTISP